MPWVAAQQSDLIARIDHWKNEVVKDTRQQASTALAEVSGNPNTRKRKACATMTDSAATKKGKKGNKGKEAEKDADAEQIVIRQGPAYTQKDNVMQQQGPLRRGRSEKILELTDVGPLDFQAPSQAPSTLWDPSNSASPRKATPSPSKRGQITLHKTTSEVAIDMDYLRRCDPPVKLTTFVDLRVEKKEIASPVLNLFKKLRDVPPGLIPSALKAVYEEDANTPRKTKDPHSKSQYLRASQTPFPQHYLSRMKSTADHVLDKARKTFQQNAHEKQWGALVSQLLCEVEIWQDCPSRIVCLNVETCSIQPVEIRPTRPNGAGRIDCDVQTVNSDVKSNAASEDIGRMIDWCLAMEVDEDDMDLILNAQASVNETYNGSSLNQSLSYIRNHSLLLDIEIKKTTQPRDPQVQLAIWASSALLKKRLHKWDASMPMPAIAVTGHLWEYYLFFEMGIGLMMAGPYHFGTTATLDGIWAIFYRLHIVMEWGLNEHADWFRANVLKRAS